MHRITNFHQIVKSFSKDLPPKQVVCAQVSDLLRQERGELV